MVVTMLEASVQADREKALTDAYASISGDLPPAIVETLLLHAVGSDAWRIVTVWRSRQDLDDYRASVETPAGVLVFRAADAEPTLTMFDVASRATH